MATAERHGWAGTPFSREELVSALTLMSAEEDALSFVAAMAEHREGVPILTDHTLLLLAVLSDDVARRVVAIEPRLIEPVRSIRADPERWRTIIEAHPGWER